MDVTLPNGVVIRGVPEGTPKGAIAFKAIVGGLAKPEDFGYESTSKGPTEGMSGFEKFRAGYGKAAVDLGRGVGQLVGAVDRDDIKEARRLDAPLMATGAGKAGNFTGAVANTIPAAFVPGANTVGGATAIGAGLGLLQPSASTGETLTNIGVGGALGGGGILAARGLASGYNAGKALVEPFTRGGQERIAGRTLQAFAGGADEAAKAAQNIEAGLQQPMLRGVQPTTAELAQNGGLAQLERTVKNNPEVATALTDRLQGNRGAMVSALDEIAGTPQQMQAATTLRGAATKPLYEAADSMVVRPDAELKSLLSRPSMKAAWERAANLAREAGEELNPSDIPEWLRDAVDRTKLAASKGGALSASQRRLQRVMNDPSQLRGTAPAKAGADGLPTSMSGRTLHYIKMAMDDLADNPQVSGIGKNEANAITSTKNQLLEWMDAKLPTYGMARRLFTEMSKPTNRMQIGKALRDKLQPALADFGATTRSRGEMYARALREGDDFAAQTLGRGRASMQDIMTPQQMQKLRMIGEQLARRTNADELGRAVGSNTGQNMVSQNVLRQLLGPLGLPESTIQRATESTLLRSIMRPAQWAGELGEERVLAKLAQASLEPKVAQELLRVGIDPKGLQLLLRNQQFIAPALVSGSDAARQ